MAAANMFLFESFFLVKIDTVHHWHASATLSYQRTVCTWWNTCRTIGFTVLAGSCNSCHFLSANLLDFRCTLSNRNQGLHHVGNSIVQLALGSELAHAELAKKLSMSFTSMPNNVLGCLTAKYCTSTMTKHHEFSWTRTLTPYVLQESSQCREAQAKKKDKSWCPS